MWRRWEGRRVLRRHRDEYEVKLTAAGLTVTICAGGMEPGYWRPHRGREPLCGRERGVGRRSPAQGTSVYLVDRVIPMLPHKLSNGICSLNAGTDRLALSCLMEIDSQGNVTGHEIAETVIRSDRRMTYTAVNAIVTDHDPQVTAEYAEFAEMFLLMKEAGGHSERKKRQWSRVPLT